MTNTPKTPRQMVSILDELNFLELKHVMPLLHSPVFAKIEMGR